MNLSIIADKLHTVLRDKCVAKDGGYYLGPFAMLCINSLIDQLRKEHGSVERVKQHRDELQEHSNAQLFEIRELRECLKWYVEHDDANYHDEYYMSGQNRAKKILRIE